jgi:hypothetical protein
VEGEGGSEGGKEGRVCLSPKALVFVRSPLAVLVMSMEGKRAGEKEGWVHLILHRGFPLSASWAAPEASARILIDVPGRIEEAVKALVSLPPTGGNASPCSVQALLEAVMGKEGRVEKLGGKRPGREGGRGGGREEVEVLVKKLVGILTYHGYLRPWRRDPEEGG